MAQPDTLQTLSRLAVKDRVGLGGLSGPEQAVALAVAHAALPAATDLSERDVNLALQHALAGAACWLDTDHVELRRWLVDAGWLDRDGFGRVYRARPHAALRADQQPLARALATVNVPSWVAAERQRRQAERAARHAQWLAKQP